MYIKQNEIHRCLSEGASPNEIIYANPCKQPSMIKYAADQDVKMMTFDSEEELLKINDIFPGARSVNIQMITLWLFNMKVNTENKIIIICNFVILQTVGSYVTSWRMSINLLVWPEIWCTKRRRTYPADESKESGT